MTETIYPRAPPPSSRSMVFVYGGGENIDLRGFVRKEKHGEIGRLDAVWLIVFFEFKRTEGVRKIVLEMCKRGRVGAWISLNV